MGFEIVRQVCKAPLSQIHKNALGHGSGGYIVEKLLDLNDNRLGYNAKEKSISNLVEQQIMDPTKVVKTALRYGAGLASILLTAEACVIENEFDEVRHVHQQINI